MKKNNVKLEVLMGLPGSGKTTYANSRSKQGTSIVDLDYIRELLSYRKGMSLGECVREGISRIKEYYFDTVIIDGLILTNEDIVTVISSASQVLSVSDVVIHRWNEDRETCIKNDGGRRETKSVTTIANAAYEDVDIDFIKDKISMLKISDIRTKRHDVVLKEDWYRFFRQHTYVYSDGLLYSYKWCTGGSYGSCWSNTLSPVSGEEPVDFDQLDELLQQICPDITYLHYKKMWKECISTKESYESDYYGGGTHHLQWVCDLKKMYNVLTELGYKL